MRLILDETESEFIVNVIKATDDRLCKLRMTELFVRGRVIHISKINQNNPYYPRHLRLMNVTQKGGQKVPGPSSAGIMFSASGSGS